MIPLMMAGPALQQQVPTAVEVDRLANEFIELEKKVERAYEIAVAADERKRTPMAVWTGV
jgi:hypothetical protein